ncbi:hypothetical protein BC833DRAFT_610775 [Globomyces pollinis-pini]|nr:hypothetical protein BC833DRAFT_610775 [Globomyces pollinis-pini]
MNAFFIYRKHNQQRIIKLYKVNKSQDISKMAGQCWSLEPDHIKKYYYQLAMIDQMQKENEQVALHQSQLLSPPDSFQSHLLSPPLSPLDFSVLGDVSGHYQTGVSPDIQMACASVEYIDLDFQNTL